METRYAAHPGDVKSYDTEKLRQEFLAKGLMVKDAVKLYYSHYDRFIFGGIHPVNSDLELFTYDQLKADYFLERRELGVINIGGTGSIQVDGTSYQLENLEMLYVGKGARQIVFKSNSADHPAKFYVNSTPAHHSYPTTKGTRGDANRVDLGSDDSANKRIIYQFIHEDGIQSCQLVMGYTELMPGNIWNTFPPHTHDRRMEIYFYFDLPEDQIVVHFMGQPQQTRHIAMQNEDAVISPPWSIHAGAGTSAYKFVWGMGGENKAFTDMDGVPLKEVL